ncbi:ATPase [Neisseria elongata subsp. glycolytica ATCC 29315]|uniref:ATPase n=1 Tax=Neisseria elongata subsp. glycolytica ATCC 29315 TaxID=546263 RepID=D4DU24_NEIEG|nr:cell division protein ZapE [Neisseria elongata]AJE18277.1 ATPase [Neisseria elongata subsp. glycolytica ATCC 29315]EFE48607.1 ATPase, AFG1 family [Neisseria elongata subsp. glycolytica ATCC 29315]
MSEINSNRFVPPPYHNHSPLTWYQAASQQAAFIRDAAQARAIEHLDRLWTELMMFKRKRNRFLGRSLRSPQLPKGLYFYGGVGRGKSFLMDAFYGCLPYRRKRRVHFHAFMAEIHQRLRGLKSEANPLKAVAAEIAKETRVLCFDEFHVSDIADAMILGRLLENLFNEGVVLVATSNYAPSELYPQGQNRSSFLPTIALIEEKLTILNVDGGEDYRHRTLTAAEVFYIPANDENERELADLFTQVTAGQVGRPSEIEIHGRMLRCKKRTDKAIWFDFRMLCFGPRSQADYLYLSEHYEMIFVSGIEKLSQAERAEARRLTWLIDVMYDYRVKFCATCDVPVGEIYVEGDFAQEFVRTASRLTEMQSQEYLNLPHLTLGKPV